MADCPAINSRSICGRPILRCRSTMTFCVSSTVSALSPHANSSTARFISCCFQALIIVGWIAIFRRQIRRSVFPRQRRHRHARPESAPCCFLVTPASQASCVLNTCQSDRTAGSGQQPPPAVRSVGRVALGVSPFASKVTDRVLCKPEQLSGVTPRACKAGGSLWRKRPVLSASISAARAGM
jgi:hypothetical protein